MSFESLFPVANSWLLILSLLSAATAIYFSVIRRYRWALACLALAALSVRLFVAHADPFLHVWDERFHALVARNMMDDPFKPMMRLNPIQAYDFRSWCCNHIWLHKQPLFLWQMALSMKIFGVSEFSIRYPSVLLGMLMIPLLFRIGYLSFNNKRIAFMGAALMCFCYYHLGLVSGFYGMDHNDVSFDFYVLASIWAYMEYRGKLQLKWALLIGVLAGCAILNKWLTGLLVYAGWGINILFSLREKDSRKEMVHFLLSLVACILVFLPWQLYIFHRFPREAAYELAFNGKHLWEVVEGHGGTIWYYLDYFPNYFGEAIWLLVPAGLLLVLGIKQFRNKRSIALASMFLLVFLFFSFVAQTKVHSYFMIVAPIGYLFIAHCLEYITRIPKLGRFLYVPLLGVAVLLSFKLSEITFEHHPQLNSWAGSAHNANVFRNLEQYLPPDIQVVSNVRDLQDIEIMFYNKNLDAYGGADLLQMQDKGIRVAFFKRPEEKDFTEDARQYPGAFLIPFRLE